MPIHTRIEAMSVRGRIVAPGAIVEREGKLVQRCQHDDKSNVQYTHMYFIRLLFSSSDTYCGLALINKRKDAAVMWSLQRWSIAWILRMFPVPAKEHASTKICAVFEIGCQ